MDLRIFAFARTAPDEMVAHVTTATYQGNRADTACGLRGVYFDLLAGHLNRGLSGAIDQHVHGGVRVQRCGGCRL